MQQLAGKLSSKFFIMLCPHPCQCHHIKSLQKIESSENRVVPNIQAGQPHSPNDMRYVIPISLMFREDVQVNTIEMLTSGPKFNLKRHCVNCQYSSSSFCVCVQ